MSSKSKLESQFSNESSQWNWQDSFGAEVVTIPASNVLQVFNFLKNQGHFDLLMNVTAADYPGNEKRFEVLTS